ncbi:MAG: type III pantothenate kinase [Victivallaceae bacterium]|nr:type III pantothenate kinase [Victivallaceae bacterium]
MNHYAMDVGNTHTSFVEVRSGELSGPVQTVDTADLKRELFPQEARFCVISVVPRIREIFNANEAVFPTAEMLAHAIDFADADVSTFGADRAANLLALREKGLIPGIVVDCGTAITLETLDGHGRFAGGAILPGRALLLHSLHDHTAALPLLPVGEIPEGTGRNTREAMLRGTMLGSVGMVRELVNDFRRRMPHAVVVVCGGDRRFYLEALPELRDGGMDFTLRGAVCAGRVLKCF